MNIYTINSNNTSINKWKTIKCDDHLFSQKVTKLKRGMTTYFLVVYYIISLSHMRSSHDEVTSKHKFHKLKVFIIRLFNLSIRYVLWWNCLIQEYTRFYVTLYRVNYNGWRLIFKVLSMLLDSLNKNCQSATHK